MKRLLIPAVSAMALALAVPGAAMASHGRHHHKSKSHHAAKARVEHFGPKSTTTTTAPTSNMSDNAGTVASFTNGVLTLTLNDHSTVSGMVTSNTEIECEAPQTATVADNHGDGNGSGDNSSGDGGDGQSQQTPSGQTTTTPTTTGDQNQTGDQNESGDQNANEAGDQNANQADDQNENQAAACTTADLVPGAVVHQADLRIGSTGAEFKSVKLVK
jgi:hypothetical protein